MEVNLLIDYPKSERSVRRTDQDREKALRFDEEFFDGPRECGYGGYYYDPKFFGPVAKLMVDRYGLKVGSKVTDLGCAKGFLLYEFQKLGMEVKGLDISEYAINKSLDPVKKFLSVRDLNEGLNFNDRCNLIVSLGTLHNLSPGGIVRVLKDMEWLSEFKFITVDAYRNKEEKQRMSDWNLTAKTVLHVDEWKDLFKEAGYTGDYYWVIV